MWWYAVTLSYTIGLTFFLAPSPFTGNRGSFQPRRTRASGVRFHYGGIGANGHLIRYTAELTERVLPKRHKGGGPNP